MQQQQQQQQQQLQQQLPARAAIEYTCRLLRSYGIDQLTPELIRQAKFDAPTAWRPLLQALHDLAVCFAAGLAPGCKEGLGALQQQLQQESLDGDTLPPEGVVLLLHLLAHWGCPAGLLAQLSLASINFTASSCTNNSSSSGAAYSCCSSRACLLCLAWLIGHAQLFDRALQYLQIPASLLQLLPPYAEDTSSTVAAQAKYTAAASAAQQHADKVQRLLTATPTSSGASSANPASNSCWQQVQSAAHHLLSTYRAASMQLQLLSSLLDGREKLLHQIQQAQLDSSPQQRQHSSPTKHRSSTTTSSSSSRHALTAFELHLLASPQLMQQHHQALQQGCSLLQQQLQCVQAAHTFFAWASSVLAEEHKTPAAGTCNGTASSARVVLGSTQAPYRSAAAAPCQQQQQQQQLLLEPQVADLLPLLQQLPEADSPLAAKVLLRVTQQLQAAAATAGIKLGATAGTAVVDALSAYSLSSTAQFAGSSSCSVTDASAELLLSFGKVAAAAMVANGIVPSIERELLQLPADIQQQVDSQTQHWHQQQQQQQKKAAGCIQLVSHREQHWRGQQVSSEQLQSLTISGQTQQQQQQQQQGQQGLRNQSGGLNAKALLTHSLLPGQAAAAAGGEDISSVAAAAEVQRLHGLALHVARQLAKARASNKQQLSVAGQLLMGPEAAAAAGGDSRKGDGQLKLFEG